MGMISEGKNYLIEDPTVYHALIIDRRQWVMMSKKIQRGMLSSRAIHLVGRVHDGVFRMVQTGGKQELCHYLDPEQGALACGKNIQFF
jgi:hypothetical protein